EVDAQLVHYVVQAAEEACACLCCRPAVDVDQQRTRTLEARRRAIQEPRDLHAVEAFPADHFRLAKLRRVEAVERRARPELHPARLHIERIDVSRRARRVHAKAKLGAAALPMYLGDAA